MIPAVRPTRLHRALASCALASCALASCALACCALASCVRAAARLPVLLVVAGMACVCIVPAWAETRIALVVGIGAYEHVPHLTNPVDDARAVGESLQRLGFELYEIYDPDQRALSRAIREFGVRAASADVAVVYYAGHGVQVDRENYLLPVDAKLERERDLLYEAVPLTNLLGEAAQASKIGIVLIDACRNNPFTAATRSYVVGQRGVVVSPGLARVDNVPRNTMVVLATKADQVAEDGGKHSPFAEALIAHLQVPGLELSLFFRSVRDTVLRATRNRQEPYVYSSLGAEPFYFHPRPPVRPPEIGPIKPLEVLDTAGPTLLGLPRPVDPDQEPMTVRVTGLPISGEVRIDGREVALNAVFALDKFMLATFKPNRRSLGPVGTLDILIEDGRGGVTTAVLPISVSASNHPPLVEVNRAYHARSTLLGIQPPTDPDGDPLTVTIIALPRGAVRKGPVPVKLGDRLQPDELPMLGFVPDPDAAGDLGALRYRVDDGRGGSVEGRVVVDVAETPAAEGPADARVWAGMRDSAAAADLDAFLQLFPSSHFAEDARHRRDTLVTAAKPAPPSAPVKSASLAPPAEIRSATAPVPPPAAASQDPDAATFRDCPTCPVMAHIPDGTFVMGQGARGPEAAPAHRVSIKSFALGRFPVTVAEWRACMADGGCRDLPHMAAPDDRRPVHNVSWDDAQAYLSWLSGKAGHRYRLPSESEWEYAARAGAQTRYWWGNEIGAMAVNCLDCSGTQDRQSPMPVDLYQPNGFGLVGMLGGVAQWTADCWFSSYQGAPSLGVARDAPTCLRRVLRGGSYRVTMDHVTVTDRDSYDSSVRYVVNGFRVARNAD